LPELGKGLGEGLKGFREGIKGVTDPAAVPATQQTAAAPEVQATATAGNKANYRCPNCKNILTANAPNPNAAEDTGFCPECGSKFDKKTSLV
jgi:membrane protease subunit (stomatin/prohibitin family)